MQTNLKNTEPGSGARCEAPKDLAALEAILRRGQSTATIAISATLAGAIRLTWNEGNRRYNEVRAQKHKRDMDAGKWLDGSEIAFGVFDGRIVVGNGQHRFGAQVASGTTQVYHARIFTDQSDFALYVATCDCDGRTLADLLRIFGLADSNGAAQAFERIVNAMQGFCGMQPSRLNKGERADYAYLHAKSCRYVLGLPKRMFKAHVLAAIAMAHEKRPAEVERAIARVISGADLRAGSPELELSKALPDLNAARDGKAKDVAMGRVLRALCDAAHGRTRTAIFGARVTSNVMLDTIAEMVSPEVAELWAARQQHAEKAAQ